MPGSARARVRASGLPSWTCGSRSGWQRRRMHRKPRSCLTSSMSCGISAGPWVWFARGDMAALPAGAGATAKGPKNTWPPRRGMLTLDGKRARRAPLAANKRLNTAYVLKESFGQLWDYEREGWAGRFFENWRSSLKWQRLKPYEKFAAMIDWHWDGIAAYCRPDNKVSLGFVEGLNNKIRVIQRRAYGLRNEDYLRLKILTCMLPPL